MPTGTIKFAHNRDAARHFGRSTEGLYRKASRPVLTENRLYLWIFKMTIFTKSEGPLRGLSQIKIGDHFGAGVVY